MIRRDRVQPYEFIVGILWKFSRANSLRAHLLTPQLTSTPVDPHTGIRAIVDSLDVRRVARQLGLQKTDRSALQQPGGKRHTIRQRSQFVKRNTRPM